MNARFELVRDDRDRIGFRLLGRDGLVLLKGLPCDSKIAAQTEVLHARNSIRAERFVPHVGDDGSHFVVLKDKDGSVLARSPHVRDEGELAQIRAAIEQFGQDAPIVDQTRLRSPA